MYRSTLLIVLLWLLCSQGVLLAQRYVPAVVYTAAGDSLRGSVLNRNWTKNPRAIRFRNGQGIEQVYGLGDLRGFHLVRPDGQLEIYIKHIIEREASPIRTRYLDDTRVPRVVGDTAFLRLLYEGELALYVLRDQKGKQQYYVQEGKESPRLLIHKRFAWITIQGVQVYESRYFRGQLVRYTKSCQRASRQARELRYREADLLAFMRAYETCAGDGKPAYSVPVDKADVDVHLSAGGGISQLHVDASEGNTLSEFSFPVASSWMLGLDATLYGRGWRQRFGLYNEYLLTRNVFEGEGRIATPNGEQVPATARIEYTSLQMGVGLKFRFRDEGVKPELTAGLLYSFVLDQLNILQPEQQADRLAISSTRDFESGYFLSLGLRHPNFNTTLRGSFLQGLSDVATLNTEVYTLQLLFSFRLID